MNNDKIYGTEYTAGGRADVFAERVRRPVCAGSATVLRLLGQAWRPSHDFELSMLSCWRRPPLIRLAHNALNSRTPSKAAGLDGFRASTASGLHSRLTACEQLSVGRRYDFPSFDKFALFEAVDATLTDRGGRADARRSAVERGSVCARNAKESGRRNQCDWMDNRRD
jgi:hypothetical protein